jgi:uncharacterized protein (TIGR03435 family)
VYGVQGVYGQKTAAAQSFEVASIRPSPSAQEGAFPRPIRVMPGGRLVATGATLEELIRFAYGVSPFQRVVGNSIVLQRRFDVNAVAASVETSATVPKKNGEDALVKQMLQKLLGDRFNLRVRWDQQEQAVLKLVRARADGKLGPGLRSSTVNCSLRAPEKTQGFDDLQACQLSRINGRLRSRGVQMGDLAVFLSELLQRPVVDQTGLSGPFEIDMTSNSEGIPRPVNLPPPPGAAAPTDRDPADAQQRPPLTTALKEQLGLALEPARERVPSLVVERVAPLTEN